MLDAVQSRKRMVTAQLIDRGISDERVLEAMGRVPREAFVPPSLREFAYEDSPLGIEEGQTISQPYIVALMLEAAALSPSDRALEIGTGSGYAVAVMARICQTVITIERHAVLAESASRRVQELGLRNVSVHVADGSTGWPEGAPFDAIIVPAGAPAVPGALRDQLRVGGRLVMPVGGKTRQQLVKITRLSADAFDEEHLSDVRFVPLIGEQGWAGQSVKTRTEETTARPLPDLIVDAAELLPDPSDPSFADAFDRFAGARIVLLGEASHGSSEFYQARAAITRRLIEQHGFRIVAVEADWPDAAVVDRFVRDRRDVSRQPAPFRRFPTWMWRNTDVDAFLRWLRQHNARREESDRAAFYGLDLYNLSASIRAVIDYLDRTNPEAAEVARQRYGCLTPWQHDPQIYGRIALTSGFAPCEDAVAAMLKDLLEHSLTKMADRDSLLDAAGSARLVADAEKYYRAMYYGSTESWNLRDRHMFETLCHVLERWGPNAKAVVWAHNSHIGDASKTEMGRARGELNVGQLCRERFGDEAMLIGFGTHSGTVACASDWDQPMEVKDVRPSLEDSYERLARRTGLARFLLDFRRDVPQELMQGLGRARPERFIGVIYRPETERWSHYAMCTLPEQFDAYVWFDETHAVTPLGPEPRKEGEDETFPFGL